MTEKYDSAQTAELAAVQNATMLFNTLLAPSDPPEKERDKVKESPHPTRSRELVSLQRRCSNNLNQVAIQVNTYGGIYPNEITALQKDYADLWESLSELLEKLAAVVKL